MSKQDFMGVRNFFDVQKELLGLKKNLIYSSNTLLKVNNEMNNILTSLIINLKDILGDQSEVSLWFYSGVPTTLNSPYKDWATPSTHYGDIYYDQATGYVYQYKSTGWELNTDTNLIQAMALTNVELDTTVDHERRVYFAQPTPPYSSGDWWILEDGTLKICQLGKTSGVYSTNDFIVSSKYVATIATKTNDSITVLKGTVTEISDNYVSVTDLATGGKTTINGANIKSGTITLSDALSIANDNVVINKSGITLKNGAGLITDKGLLSNLQFTNTESMALLGVNNFYNNGYSKSKLTIDINIPPKFTATNAYVTIIHQPTFWNLSVWGYAKNIGVYKADLTSIFSWDWMSDSGITTENRLNQIAGVFNGSNTWQPSIPNSSVHPIEVKTTSDILSQINNTGYSQISIQTADTLPVYPGDSTTDPYCLQNTGFAMAVVNVLGFMKN